MKRIQYLEVLSSLFSFKVITDNYHNEYIVYKSSNLSKVENISDKTAFEASENHVHIIDNISKKEFDNLIPIAIRLGQSLLCNLKYYYPQKNFMVFVSIRLHDSMIIRFHQKWKGEEPYCCPNEFLSSTEKVFLFE